MSTRGQPQRIAVNTPEYYGITQTAYQRIIVIRDLRLVRPSGSISPLKKFIGNGETLYFGNHPKHVVLLFAAQSEKYSFGELERLHVAGDIYADKVIGWTTEIRDFVTHEKSRHETIDLISAVLLKENSHQTSAESETANS